MIDKKINEKSTIKLNFDLIKQEVKANLSNSFTPKKNKVVALVSLLSLLLINVLIIASVFILMKVNKINKIKDNVSPYNNVEFQKEYLEKIFSGDYVGAYKVIFPNFEIKVSIYEDDNYSLSYREKNKDGERVGYIHAFEYVRPILSYKKIEDLLNSVETRERMHFVNGERFVESLVSIKADFSKSDISTEISNYNVEYPDINVNGKFNEGNNIKIDIKFLYKTFEITDVEFSYVYNIEDPTNFHISFPGYDFYPFNVKGKIDGVVVEGTILLFSPKDLPC